MGWLFFVGLLAWVVVLGLAPETLYRLAPASLRTNSWTGVGGWLCLLVMFTLPVAVMVWWGHSLQAGGWLGSDLRIPLGFGFVLGLPASAVSLRAWRTQRVLVASVAPALDLGLRASQVPACSVHSPSVPRNAFAPAATGVATNRLLRRTRTVLVAAGVGLYGLARAIQLFRVSHSSYSTDVPGAVLVLLLGCVVGSRLPDFGP